MKHETWVYIGAGWEFQFVSHQTKVLLNLERAKITWSKFLINVLNHRLLLVGSQLEVDSILNFKPDITPMDIGGTLNLFLSFNEMKLELAQSFISISQITGYHFNLYFTRKVLNHSRGFSTIHSFKRGCSNRGMKAGIIPKFCPWNPQDQFLGCSLAKHLKYVSKHRLTTSIWPSDSG